MRVITSLFVLSLLLTASAKAIEPKEWTVLVYENGNNDLDNFIQMDLNEMETVGSTDQINIVAEWGSYQRQKVVRLKVQRDNDRKNITSPVLQDLGRADMGDYRQVVDFVRWGVQNFPAKHYFLIISDHGAGWRASGGQIVSIDEMSGHGIHLPQLSIMAHEVQKILGRNLDLMGFDACLMAMAEVAAEFYGMTDFLVASQEVEPGYGWDYIGLFNYFAHYPSAAPAALGQAAIKAYVGSYQGGIQGNADVTLALINVGVMDQIAKDVRDFAQLVTQKASSDQKVAISRAFASAQHFYNSDYIDLMNFYELVKRDSKLASVIPAQWIADAQGRLQKAILANGVSPRYNQSHGLSIWGPDQSYFQQYGREYQMTRFDRGTKWSTMLGSLYQNLSARNITLNSGITRRRHPALAF